MSGKTKRTSIRGGLLGLVLAASALGASGAGCDSEQAGSMPGPDPLNMLPAGGQVSFSRDIQPIFDARCIDCHAAGGFAVLAGIPMFLDQANAFAAIVNQPSSQNPSFILVTPGDAATSLLWLKVSSNSPPVGARMPLFDSALSSAQQALIRNWIDQGAFDN